MKKRKERKAVNRFLMLISYNMLVFRRYKYYSLNSIKFNFTFIFNKICNWQTRYMQQFYKVLPNIFSCNATYIYFIYIIKAAFLYNYIIPYKSTVYANSASHAYHIPRYMQQNTIISSMLQKFNIYYNIIYNMLYVIYFNLILKRNTAFLQCVSGSNDIIFTTTSTQFGFKKYKRYARFIVEFFLLLSFSYVMDFGLRNIAFKLKLLNYFKYMHIIRKFVSGVKSFRFRFYCKDTSEEFKRYYRFLKLQKYSEYKYKHRYLFFFVHNRVKGLNVKFNLNLKPKVYNLLSEICGLCWFTLLYFQYALDISAIVSRSSIKYFFKPFYTMFNVHGFGAFIYQYEYYIIRLYNIVSLIFFNFYLFKHTVCIFLLFYNRILNFNGLFSYQKRFLAKISFTLSEYSCNYINFKLLKYVTILYFFIIIKLKRLSIIFFLKNKLLCSILNYIYMLFKYIFLFFYSIVCAKLNVEALYKFSRSRLNFNLIQNNFFYKEMRENYSNINFKYDIYLHNLHKYYRCHPNFKVIHVFQNIQYIKVSFKYFWRSFYQSYFRRALYTRSSYTKFLNSSDGLDIPYVIIKQVSPFGGGCKLSKIRRKKVRSYKNKYRSLGNLFKGI